MKCPTCQSENPAENRYCHKCGSAMDGSTSRTVPYSPAQEAKLSQGIQFKPGERFGSRYTIIEEIGRGGMGRVYKAKDRELGATVALKIIRPELSSQPGMIDQFRKETLLGRSVSQENVVRIHDLGEVGRVRYISMDFIKGTNLSELIRTSGTLTLSTCLQIALQVCQALIAAHGKGIVHQDLKPQNIMIDNSGKVFVMDFGLAKSLSLSQADRRGKSFGTPKYFSPEQARGEESDQRSDIYSLGVILYEMMTGAAPFDADTVEGYIRKHTSEKPPLPSKINPAIPPALEKIILKCLEKRKEDRYKSVEDLLQDLEVQKKRVGRPAARLLTRNWQKTLTSVALVLLFVIVVLGLFKLFKPVQPPLRSPGRSSIAVMYAVNNSTNKSLTDQLRWVIQYYLATDLAQSKYLNVLPQDRLMQILLDMNQYNEEHHLSKTLDRISERASVDYFVLPSFTKVGDNFWISFTIRKARSDETLGEPDSVKGKRIEDVLSMVDDLSLKVKSRLSISPAEIAGDTSQNLASITTNSLEAARYYIEGEKYYVQSNFQASIQFLEKAVEADPEFALAYLKMAEDYNYLGEYDNNRKYLQKAMALVDRVSARDRCLIEGYACLILNESPLPAIEIYKKLIALYPGHEEGYSKLGDTYRDIEEWSQALDQYEKVLAINPKNSLALENKIFILSALGRYKEALDLIGSIAADFVDQSFIFRELSLLDIIQGHFDGASAELEKARARLPDNFDLMEMKGVCLLLGGNLTSAAQVFEQLRLKGEASPGPSNLRGRFWTTHLHLLQGQFHQAQKAILEGVELAKKSGRAYDELEFRSLLAYSELRLHRFSQAAEASKLVLDVAKKTMNKRTQKLAWHLLGLADLGMNQIKDARAIAQQLRQLIDRTGIPKHMRHYEHLTGHIALAEGRPDQAVDHFQRAISGLSDQMEIIDDQAFYYDSLAAAQFQNGDWPLALKTYQDILSLTTGRLQWGDIYSLSYYWLGKIYQRSGNNSEAVARYENFLNLWKNSDEGLPEVADARKQLATLKKPS